MKTEIDYYDQNEHVREKDGKLIVVMAEFPDEFTGKIMQEFIEKDDEPGMFEEFVIKELEEE